MKEKETVVVYADWWKRAEELPDERRLAYYDAIMRYAFSGQAPENELTEADTAIIRMTIDRDALKFSEKSEKRRKAINKRWSEYKRIQNIQKNNLNYENENENENENGSIEDISLKSISSTTTTNNAHTREETDDAAEEQEFLKNFLSNERLILALSQEISLQPHLLKATAENIASQWEAEGKTHEGYGDFSSHMAATLRKKQGSPPMQTAEPLEERVLQFKKELAAAKRKLEVSNDMANDFYYYWTESKDGKMKFEMEKVWNTERRLLRWRENKG